MRKRSKGILTVREMVALRECGTKIVRIAELDGTDHITIHHHLRKWDKEYGPRKKTNIVLSDLDAAYVAGLMDGDGCYGIYDHPDMQQKNPHIQLAMTDKDVVTWVAKLIQRKVTYREPGPGRKPVYALQLSSTPAVNFAREVYPYMRLKRKRDIVKKMLCWKKMSSANAAR